MTINVVMHCGHKMYMCDDCFRQYMAGSGDCTSWMDDFTGHYCPECGKRDRR
jgi:hypothetical protein